MSEEPHRLLLEHNLRQDTKFRDYLLPYEVVSGMVFGLSVKIVNMGTRDFPGGKLNQAEIRYALGGFSGVISRLAQQLQIPILQQNHEVTLDLGNHLPLQEGSAWIYISINAEDNQPIEYYQQRGGPSLGRESWQNVFNIVDRFTIQMLERLKNIEEKITRR